MTRRRFVVESSGRRVDAKFQRFRRRAPTLLGCSSRTRGDRRLTSYSPASWKTSAARVPSRTAEEAADSRTPSSRDLYGVPLFACVTERTVKSRTARGSTTVASVPVSLRRRVCHRCSPPPRRDAPHVRRPRQRQIRSSSVARLHRETRILARQIRVGESGRQAGTTVQCLSACRISISTSRLQRGVLPPLLRAHRRDELP